MTNVTGKKKRVHFVDAVDVREIEGIGERSTRESIEANSTRRAVLRELRHRAKVDRARTPREVQAAWVEYLADHPTDHLGMQTFRKNIKLAKKGRMTPYVATHHWRAAYHR